MPNDTNTCTDAGADDIATNKIACKLCGNEAIVDAGVVNSYNLVRCPKCQFLSVKTTADQDMSSFYEKDYFNGNLAYGYGCAQADEIDAIAQPLAEKFEWLISRYIDPLDPKAILEIGPGVGGGWIKRFRSDAARILQCVEISALASSRLNEAGIPTFNGQVEEFRSDTSFDMAIAIEVIEHVADPVTFVRKVAELLAPGGHVLLTTGNTRSITARRSGLGWYYLDPPAHLSFFDDRNIASLLRREGFDQVKVMRFGFKWVELALRYKVTAALPLLQMLNYPSGMIILASKPADRGSA